MFTKQEALNLNPRAKNENLTQNKKDLTLVDLGRQDLYFDTREVTGLGPSFNTFRAGLCFEYSNQATWDVFDPRFYDEKLVFDVLSPQ